MAASERSQLTLRLASLFGLCRDILRSHLLICRIFNYQFPAWRNARRRSAQLKCQGTNRPSPALNPGSVELRRVLAKPRVLHPQFANKCFGGIHGCHPVRGFPARFDAGNGACGLGAADGSRGLHARRATSVYRRRVSLVQRRDSERRPRQGLPAQEQGAA